MHRNLDFIDQGDGPYEVVEHSRRSWQERGPEGQRFWHRELRWRYSDGTEATLHGNSFYGDVVPAKSGFEMLFVTYDLADDSPIIHRQSVIAWRILGPKQDATLEPIVQDANERSHSFSGTVQPDGRIYSKGDWFASESDFITALKPEWLKKKDELVMRERHRDCPFCAEARRRDDDFPF